MTGHTARVVRKTAATLTARQSSNEASVMDVK
jgi:hypothetical protein